MPNTTTMATPKSLKQVREIKLPTGVLSLAAAFEGPQLYAGCHDGVYRLSRENDAFERLYEHDSYVSGVVLADETTLISAGYDGRLQWYDLAAGKLIRQVDAHSFWSWNLSVTADGSQVASVGGQYLAGGERYEPAAAREPSVRVFDARSGELIHSFDHVPPVQSVAFSPDGRHLAAANLMGEVRVWEVASGRLAAQWTTPDFTSWGIIKSHCYIGGIHALAFTADGQEILAAGMGDMRDPMAGNGRHLWQRFAWTKLPPEKTGEIVEKQAGRGLMEALAVHPSGAAFVMAGRVVTGDWNCGLFSTASGELLHGFKNSPRLTSAVFSADGRHCFLGGTHGQSLNPDARWGRVVVLEVDEG